MRLVVPTSRTAGARPRHDIGNAEAVADFDQLAARDHHFAAGGQFVERQKDGGGIVIDRDAGRAQQPLQQARGVHIALAAAPGREIVFQVGIAGQHVDGAQRRASQVGMQHHPGGIDDAPQRRAFERRQRLFDARFDGRPGGGAAQDFRPEFIQRAPSFRRHQRAREPRQGGEEAFEHFMHRRQFAQLVVFGPRIRWYTGNVGAWLSLARAPGSGPGGRWFESTRPDQKSLYSSNRYGGWRI